MEVTANLDDLAYLSATDAIGLFRSGDLEPIELLEAVIERAEETEPVVNAYVATYHDEARRRALEAGVAYRSGSARPLEGIPVAVKDELRVAGQAWSQGSVLQRDLVADRTDPPAQRIIDVGGILHGRSATPEFSMTIVTWSHLHGITRNPWNPSMSPGGSSGGSGASLAAGSTTLATGSDLAGSIRIPASLNGVVGFKPPWGRVPETWPWNRDTYASSGPMARTVADLVVFENVLAGPLASNIFSLPPLDLPDTFAGLEGMKIALSHDLGYFSPDREVVVAMEEASALLQLAGATVAHVDIAWSSLAIDVAETHFAFQAGNHLRTAVAPDRYDDVTPYVRAMLEGDEVTPQQWIASWQEADRMFEVLQHAVFLAGFDALVCPTLTTTEIPADLGHPDSDDPSGLDASLEIAMTYPFNMLAKLPVIDVPVVVSSTTGVPIGVQIVGPADADAVVFRVASGLERMRGPFFDRYRPAV